MAHHELHPLCTYFPRLEGADFDSLRDDIAANGQRQPIVLLDNMILDGGNRYRACLEAGVKPTFAKFSGGNPVTFVLSANLHRRHMTAGQRATIVALATDWATAHKHGGSRKQSQGEGLHLETVAQRSALSGATTRTQKEADKLVRNAPAKAEEVRAGKKSLYQATKEARPTKPAAKPEVQPKKTNKGAPTIEALQADNEALRTEIATLRDNNHELAALLESYDSVTASEHEAAKALAKVKGQLRTVEATRDQWMTTAGELRKEVKALQRKLGARQ